MVHGMGVQDVVVVCGIGGPRCGSGMRYRGSKMWYAVWG